MMVISSVMRRFGAIRRRSSAVLLLVVCLLTPGPVLGYQLPYEGNHPDDMEYDLAAMTLRPEAYDIDGLAVTDSRLMGPDWFAEYFAAETGADPDDLSNAFDDAGLNAVFLTLAAVPSESDPDEYGIVTQSTAMEFADDDGASAGFELMQIDHPDAEVIGTPDIGDEAILIRLEAEEGGQDYVLAGLVFQVDNIIGIVEMLWIDDAMASELDADQIIEVALQMEERVDDAIDGDTSGLVMKLLRLDGTDEFPIRTDFDSVDVENGGFYPPYGSTDDQVEPLRELWEDTEVEQLHRVAISFVPGDDPENPGAVYITRLLEFGNDDDAQAFIEPATEFFLERGPDSGYSDLEPVDDLPEVDGDVVVIRYAYDFGRDETVTGYRVWMQVDNYVITMEADSLDGVDLDALLGLLEEQVSCVEEDGYCEPMEVPGDLFG